MKTILTTLAMLAGILALYLFAFGKLNLGHFNPLLRGGDQPAGPCEIRCGPAYNQLLLDLGWSLDLPAHEQQRIEHIARQQIQADCIRPCKAELRGH